MARICIFGASSTWGAWDAEKGGWVNRLRLWTDEQFLKDRGESLDWRIYNLGVSGDTSSDVLDRFENELEAREAKMVIISIGDNDTAYGKSPHRPKINEDEFADNIEQLITMAKVSTDQIILLGLKRVTEDKVQPVWWNEKRNYCNANIKAYDARLKKIANEQKIKYVPMFDLLTDDDLEDGLHPNARGHEKIFQRVKDFLVQKAWLETNTKL